MDQDKQSSCKQAKEFWLKNKFASCMMELVGSMQKEKRDFIAKRRAEISRENKGSERLHQKEEIVWSGSQNMGASILHINKNSTSTEVYHPFVHTRWCIIHPPKGS